VNWFSVTCGEHLVSSLSWVSLMGLLLPTLPKASKDKLQCGSDREKPLESRQTRSVGRGQEVSPENSSGPPRLLSDSTAVPK
jgi:hypothetical protein